MNPIGYWTSSSRYWGRALQSQVHSFEFPSSMEQEVQFSSFGNFVVCYSSAPIVLPCELYFSKAPFTRERNGTERCGTVPENKEIFAGVHTRTTRNVPFRFEKWTALKSEP